MTTSNKTRRTIILRNYIGGLTALRKSVESLVKKLSKQGYEVWSNEQFHFSGFYIFVELENEILQYRFQVGKQSYGHKYGHPMSLLKSTLMESLEEETK